jgi:hypothetical protein
MCAATFGPSDLRTATPDLRTFAPPHRTLAPSHRRTLAPSHRRTLDVGSFSRDMKSAADMRAAEAHARGHQNHIETPHHP